MTQLEQREAERSQAAKPVATVVENGVTSEVVAIQTPEGVAVIHHSEVAEHDIIAQPVERLKSF